MFRENERTGHLPFRLFNVYLFCLVRVGDACVCARNGVDLDILFSANTKQIRFKVLFFVYVDDSEVQYAVIVQSSTDVQPGSGNSTTDPCGLSLSGILARADINGNSRASHVFAEQQEGPPRGLLVYTALSSHEW